MTKDTRNYGKDHPRFFAEGGSVGLAFDNYPVDSEGNDQTADLAVDGAKAEMDGDEVRAGKRFFDSGTRIPGRQKAANDTYEKKRKAR